MKIPQLQENLERLFYQENNRLIFWYDPEQEFLESIPELEIDGVTILRMDNWGSLELKLKLEREDPENRYLLYSPNPEPDMQRDWFLDIKLYSHVFHADQASMILNELGLNRQGMREHLQERKRFFRSKQRSTNLKKWINPDDNEEELDKKLLAVAVQAEDPSVFAVTMKVLSEFAEILDSEYENINSWDNIKKCGLENPFWHFMYSTFGYSVDTPGLYDLCLRFFITDLIYNLDSTPPKSVEHFLLPQGNSKINLAVFMSQWRSHVQFFQSYNSMASYLDNELQVDQIINDFDEEDLLGVMTFPSVERKIIRSLRDRINPGDNSQSSQIASILEKRKNGHWAGKANLTQETNPYLACYHSLEKAMDLYQYRHKYYQGLSFSNPQAMFQSYTSELYIVDQLYRQFCEQADIVELGGWDVLKGLQDSVEDCYAWLLEEMSLVWGSFLDKDQDEGFLENWSLNELGIQNQQNFFSTYIKPIIRQSPNSRVFVIISDAFRYEAAQELLGEINSKYRFQGKLSTILGVLPSYTSLGMAALLPHNKIQIGDPKNILVDEKPTSNLEQRSRVLSEYQGIALKSDRLFEVNKNQGRELIKPYRVVYIYHDRIDSTGDNASSEDQTFEAVRKTIQELDSLVRIIINSLNGTHVLVTADHGFVFSNRPPQEVDKSVLDLRPQAALETKKRYILGKGLGEDPKVWHANTGDTAGTSDQMEFWIPKGLNRFHFVGGAKFIHGGASLQEIVVPVISIREMKGKQAVKSETSKPGVSILGSSSKITSTISRFQFIQTETVSERIKPRSLLISLRDENDLISNEERLTFDSQSESLDDRKKSVKLTLKPREYDNKKDYYLVLRDSETQIEYDRIPYKIDLAFMDEF